MDALTPSDADARAKVFAVEATRGIVPDQIARWEIAALVRRTQIASQVARRNNHPLDYQETADLEERLNEIITGKIVGSYSPTMTAGGALDLERVASGTSVIGWSRQLMYSCITTHLRNETHRKTRLQPVDPAPDARAPLTPATSIYHQASVTEADPLIEELLSQAEDATDDYEESLVLKRYFGVTTDILWPLEYEDLLWAREHFTGDGTAAYASLASWYALITSMQTPEQRLVDDRALAIWDDFTPAEAELLLEGGIVAVDFIVKNALAPRRRPTARVITKAKRHVSMYRPDSRWSEFAEGLIESYVGIVFQPQRIPGKGLRLDAHVSAAGRWNELTTTAAAWDRAPLGRSRDEIFCALADVFETVNR